jgi:cobalt-zinc-cadmium efflux system outer membrane protein
MLRRYSAVLLAILCLQFAPARAQENISVPDVVDLQAVLRLVREASPRLAVDRQAVAGAEANRITAGAYPNPIVSYGRYRPGGGQATLFDGTRQEQTTVELPLLIAGQRSARVEKSERDIDAARARVASGASSLAAEAGSAFVALLAAQEKAALLATANEELVRMRDIVAGRESSGVASRYDVTRLQIELGGFRAKLDDAKADIADRAGNLATLLGLPKWRPRAAGDLRPLVLRADALDNPRDRAPVSPASITALREETAAHSGVEVARRERWPVPSVSAGRAWTSEPFGAANFLGLSVEIPILDSRRGALAKAEAEAIAAAMRRKLVQTEVATNLERYANVIAVREAALQRFQEDASARLPLLKQMAEDAYRLGRGTIFELLDSTRSRYDLHQTRIDLVAALVEAQLRFLATSGELERGIGPGTPPTQR